MVGPREHPISPPNASKANMAFKNVPGQKIPTEKPHNMHPINDNHGYGDRPNK